MKKTQEFKLVTIVSGKIRLKWSDGKTTTVDWNDFWACMIAREMCFSGFANRMKENSNGRRM
jgi:hypothetical protein